MPADTLTGPVVKLEAALQPFHFFLDTVRIKEPLHRELAEDRSPPVNVVEVDVGAVPPADGDAVVLEQLHHHLFLVKTFEPLDSLNFVLKWQRLSLKAL